MGPDDWEEHLAVAFSRHTFLSEGMRQAYWHLYNGGIQRKLEFFGRRDVGNTTDLRDFQAGLVYSHGDVEVAPCETCAKGLMVGSQAEPVFACCVRAHAVPNNHETPFLLNGDCASCFSRGHRCSKRPAPPPPPASAPPASASKRKRGVLSPVSVSTESNDRGYTSRRSRGLTFEGQGLTYTPGEGGKRSKVSAAVEGTGRVVESLIPQGRELLENATEAEQLLFCRNALGELLGIVDRVLANHTLPGGASHRPMLASETPTMPPAQMAAASTRQSGSRTRSGQAPTSRDPAPTPSKASRRPLAGPAHLAPAAEFESPPSSQGSQQGQRQQVYANFPHVAHRGSSPGGRGVHASVEGSQGPSIAGTLEAGRRVLKLSDETRDHQLTSAMRRTTVSPLSQRPSQGSQGSQGRGQGAAHDSQGSQGHGQGAVRGSQQEVRQTPERGYQSESCGSSQYTDAEVSDAGQSRNQSRNVTPSRRGGSQEIAQSPHGHRQGTQ
jgi:Protein of unknown function (DUF3716)